MRNNLQFKLKGINNFKKRFLLWSKKFEHAIILDSNNYTKINQSDYVFHSFEFVAGIESLKIIKPNKKIKSFILLKKNLSNNNDWWFGYLTYDLKNELEELKSENFDGLKFPSFYFFCPKLVFYIKNNLLTIEYYEENYSNSEIQNIFNEIIHFQIPKNKETLFVKINERFTKKEYQETVNKIKNHIQLGDIYEMNFCQEFYATNTQINPYFTYQNLNASSPTPFSCFLRINQNYLLSASPERFLKKDKNKIIAQPIKGTIKRSDSPYDDKKLIKNLQYSEKERAENIMIVDLVRNDLSKVAKKASVKVEELCGIYTYKQVHQMISTISAELKEGINPIEVIEATFPMGSMTGAPKLKAMKLIEKYERTKRGLFSGTVGYFDPNKNFDFNVIIRSILYNEKNNYLSYSVGGAITNLSNAEDEYDECLLKAKAINKVLKNEN